MTPADVNRFSSLREGVQNNNHPQTYIPKVEISPPCPYLFSIQHDRGGIGLAHHSHYLYHHHHHDHHHQQQTPNDTLRSSDLIRQSLLPTNDHKNGCMKRSLPHRYDREDNEHCSLEWTSSKVQRKMMHSDQLAERRLRRRKRYLQGQEQEKKDDGNGIIRVCSNCNTTRTPLWRSGPRGPKSLCNACGIRQRKARLAMAALAAAGGAVISAEQPIEMKERNEEDQILPYKKRCRIKPTAKKKVQFEDIITSLSSNSAFHQVFPQDEKDAAILLMDLSCGLIHG